MFIRPLLPLAGLLLTVSLPLSATQPGTTKGAPFSGYAAKQAAIEAKLEAARSFANESQVVGLEKTLSEVKEHRTGAGLLRENKQKVIDSEREVSKRGKDLRKVMGKGDPGKIEKHKAELAETCTELEEAKKGLEQIQTQQDTRYRPTPRTSHTGRMMPMALPAIRTAAGHQVPPSTIAATDEHRHSFTLPLTPSRQDV